MSDWLRGPRDRIALAFGRRAVRYGELERAIRDAALPAAETGRSVAIAPGTDPIDTVVTLLACLERARPVIVGADASARERLAPLLPPATELAVLTNGSSSADGPRAVARTNASWLASAGPLAEATGPADRIAITGPMHVSMHLYATLHALWLGATATDDAAGAELAHATPTRLARLLASPTPPRHVVVAGAATSDGLRAAAAARGIHLTEYYGAAELSFVAIGDGAGLRAFPGVEIELRDVAGGRELWARSPYLALDLVGGQPMRRDERGYATVGDLAEPIDGSTFRVRGRGDAAVTTAGETVLVEDVEARLAGMPEFGGVAVLGEPHELLGERLVAVVEPAAGTDPAALDRAIAAMRDAGRAALPAALLAALPAAWQPRRWFVVDRLPRTDGGKLARGALRSMLSEGRLRELRPGANEIPTADVTA